MVFKQRAKDDEQKSERAATADSKRRAERSKDAVRRRDRDKDDAPKKSGRSDNRFIRYFQETGQELKKVAWPTREQAMRLTLIVLGGVIVFAIIFGALDVLFQRLMALLVTV